MIVAVIIFIFVFTDAIFLPPLRSLISLVSLYCSLFLPPSIFSPSLWLYFIFILGSLTYLAKDSSVAGADDRPGGFPVKYLVGDTKPPAASSTSSSASTTPTTTDLSNGEGASALSGTVENNPVPFPTAATVSSGSSSAGEDGSTGQVKEEGEGEGEGEEEQEQLKTALKEATIKHLKGKQGDSKAFTTLYPGRTVQY